MLKYSNSISTNVARLESIFGTGQPYYSII